MQLEAPPTPTLAKERLGKLSLETHQTDVVKAPELRMKVGWQGQEGAGR